jgi:hypothetical protein
MESRSNKVARQKAEGLIKPILEFCLLGVGLQQIVTHRDEPWNPLIEPEWV